MPDMCCCGAFIMPQDLPGPARAEAADGPRPLTGRHVLIMFIAFFAVVASVNGYMMRMALSTMPGLDARNGYDVSQRYNGLIADARLQERAGWQADLSVDPTPGGARASLSLTRPDASASAPLEVSLRLDHPVKRSRDIVIAMRQAGPGLYVGATSEPAAGLWTVTITAVDPATGETVFRSRNRTTITGG
jgi:nitrogen fixation protein FixH